MKFYNIRKRELLRTLLLSTLYAMHLSRVCKYPKKIVPGGSGIPELFFRVSGRISGMFFPPEMASITLNLANFKKQKIFLNTGGQLEHLFIQF